MKGYYITVDDEYCYAERPTYREDGAVTGFTKTLLMTKEAFVECYNKWIKAENEDNKDDLQ